MPTNSWNHVLFSYDGEYVKLYLNESLIINEYNPGVITNSNNNLSITTFVFIKFITKNIDNFSPYCVEIYKT